MPDKPSVSPSHFACMKCCEVAMCICIKELIQIIFLRGWKDSSHNSLVMARLFKGYNGIRDCIKMTGDKTRMYGTPHDAPGTERKDDISESTIQAL